MADCLGLRGVVVGAEELEEDPKRALALRHLRETVDSATDGAFLRAKERLRTRGAAGGGGG